ncbi:MAG: cyclic nucleotide-binding domain-containing protein, partial [Thermoanaerobaculia bacterium]
AQVRYQQRQTVGRFKRDAEQAVREEIRRNAIDAFHFFGLAALYDERGKQDLAVECLEIARGKDLVNPYVHKLAGKLFFKQRRFDLAAAELRAAQRYNPFDRQIAELLGRVEYELEHYRESLEATVDAFLLLTDDDRDHGRELINRIRSLKKIRGISSESLVEIFHHRRDKLQTAFDRLELQRERLLLSADDGTEEKIEAPKDPQGRRIELAVRLREFDIWSRLDDEQVFQLTHAAHEERCRKGAKIFDYESVGADIYVLEKGRISIRRPTAYGNFELGVLRPGSVFGEVSFLMRSPRTGEAIAIDGCRLVRLDAEELEVLVNDQPELGVEIYLSLWQSLAEKLRDANDQLRTFFSSERSAEELLKLRQSGPGESGDVDVHSDEKIRLLREQGLTGAELTTLANFSDVKRYPAGEFLFHEGDEGDEMYVVLDGKVMITKLIPGGGEEALAILTRGDFFGEMALIDGQPRSADAKAFQGPVTVIVFDDKSLQEVLSMEPVAALDFMKLLCRLICKRLQEIDEKVTGWRIMSGSQPVDERRSAEPPSKIYRSA